MIGMTAHTAYRELMESMKDAIVEAALREAKQGLEPGEPVDAETVREYLNDAAMTEVDSLIDDINSEIDDEEDTLADILIGRLQDEGFEIREEGE